jgi:hypothetical protein
MLYKLCEIVLNFFALYLMEKYLNKYYMSINTSFLINLF